MIHTNLFARVISRTWQMIAVCSAAALVAPVGCGQTDVPSAPAAGVGGKSTGTGDTTSPNSGGNQALGGTGNLPGSGGNSSLGGNSSGGVTAISHGGQGTPVTGPVVDGRLGSSCKKDGDCSSGLICLTDTSQAIRGGSPGGGLCTTPCTPRQDGCKGLSPGGVCVNFGANAYCMERCAFGLGNPAKCHNRDEFACARLYDSGAPELPACGPGDTCPAGTDCRSGSCYTLAYACLPQCRNDSDCPPGNFCDGKSAFGWTGGVCKTAPSPGLATGATCTQTDQCRGTCGSFGDTSACRDGCVLGKEKQCGWTGVGPAPAACFVRFYGTEQQGDASACSQLCDCDRDCSNPALKCLPFRASSMSPKIYGRAGYCTEPPSSGLACPNGGAPAQL